MHYLWYVYKVIALICYISSFVVLRLAPKVFIWIPFLVRELFVYIDSITQVTKAGVPSNKVVVGVSSYGRAFGMTTPGCAGEMCTYGGPISTASPGECTLTPGYIGNAEINDLISQGLANETFCDESFSDILVYNDNQWIAYMADDNKATRTTLYTEYSMGGTSDWAIDLQSFSNSVGNAGGTLDLPECANSQYYATVDAVIADAAIPPNCVNMVRYPRDSNPVFSLVLGRNAANLHLLHSIQSAPLETLLIRLL